MKTVAALSIYYSKHGLFILFALRKSCWYRSSKVPFGVNQRGHQKFFVYKADFPTAASKPVFGHY